MPDAALRRALDDLMPMIARRLQELQERVQALEGGQDPEERLKGLHRGTWAEGEEYPPGVFVTHAGSLWFSKDRTAERPGHGETAWRLVVKRGAAPSLQED